MLAIRVNGARTKAALPVALAFASAFASLLGGCSIPVADLPSLGTPADAPPRPKDAGVYLPVNQLPPDRDETAMNAAERAKVQAELIAARERQASAAAKKDQAAGGDQNQSAK
jgi:hypothetical protein